jgi:hypothetical protein
MNGLSTWICLDDYFCIKNDYLYSRMSDQTNLAYHEASLSYKLSLAFNMSLRNIEKVYYELLNRQTDDHKYYIPFLILTNYYYEAMPRLRYEEPLPPLQFPQAYELPPNLALIYNEAYERIRKTIPLVKVAFNKNDLSLTSIPKGITAEIMKAAGVAPNSKKVTHFQMTLMMPRVQ